MTRHRRRVAELAGRLAALPVPTDTVKAAAATVLARTLALHDRTAGADVDVPPEDPRALAILDAVAAARGVDLEDPAWRAAAERQILDYLASIDTRRTRVEPS